MKKLIISTIAIGAMFSSAFGHFQMVYTPESALEKGDNIPLKIVFNHPFADEHTMDMGLNVKGEIKPVEEFFVIHKEKKTDLKKDLKSINFTGNSNTGKAYETEYKAKKMGDHVFALVPAPYYEKNEDSYIQQITKMVVNVAGAPTDWDAELGLKAEIVPLTKPYSIWAGSTFSGIVKGDGKPVPFAEIEVEYLNWDVDIKNNKMGKKPHVKAPQDSFVTLTIKADQDGKFTFGIPKAGWWGFAALGVGPDDKLDGKELSQDAVIWVQAKDMK